MFKSLIFYPTTIFLAFTFFMAGANKLFALDPATHEYLVGACKYWPGVFAPLFAPLGITADGDVLRILLGVTEILGAAALLLSPKLISGFFSRFATLGLIAIMSGAIYLHHAFNTSVFTPALLLGLLVVRALFAPSKSIKAKQA